MRHQKTGPSMFDGQIMITIHTIYTCIYIYICGQRPPHNPQLCIKNRGAGQADVILSSYYSTKPCKIQCKINFLLQIMNMSTALQYINTLIWQNRISVAKKSLVSALPSGRGFITKTKKNKIDTHVCPKPKQPKTEKSKKNKLICCLGFTLVLFYLFFCFGAALV